MIHRLFVGVGFALAAAAIPVSLLRAASPASPNNLALVTTPSTSFVSGHESLAAIHNGSSPAHSDDKSSGAYGNWPRKGTQWVQYDWPLAISTTGIDVYWFDDARGVRLPKACRLLHWTGTAFEPVPSAPAVGLAPNTFNRVDFPEITTSKLRLEFDGQGESSTGILEWRVLDSGRSPNFPPTVLAGPDRVTVLSGHTFLDGAVRDDGKPLPTPTSRWSKARGPGKVNFENPANLQTTARFSKTGSYTLQLVANDGQASATNSLHVTVTPTPPSHTLDPVPTTRFQVNSPFWNPRLKVLLTHWIPHCIQKIEDPATQEGGIDNFVQAARKLAGQTDARHRGAPFANAWVYNTLEAMCLAQLLDPQGDPEILAAQAALQPKIEDWVAKMVAAQEPDGYLHTQYTIHGHKRWSNKDDHEGYQAGYFIEAALAHHTMTGGQDPRMIQAARKLVDCWIRNIGPAPKQTWYDGHQELELALVRFGRFLETQDGPGAGQPAFQLARFLLDSRGNGSEYDQSHLPVTRQYEAVGHAVRAIYSYAGMTDIAALTGNPQYHSAIQSIWNNLVHRKYYVTGGLGSGETSEGFGNDYSLPNNAYCESCAGSGELFFQQRFQLAYGHARYADLAEETLYNAILGGLDLGGTNFTYTNPLDSGEHRYPWHVCPCCVGNLPRTLLQLPTWTYSRDSQNLYVNLFIGGTTHIPDIAGTSLRITQATDYPWKGAVAFTLHPAQPARFTLHLRSPDRSVSDLYSSTPDANGFPGLRLNGKPVKPRLQNGYATLTRTWNAGDRVELDLPLLPQRVHCIPNVAANRGRVALRLGPLLYNLESVDQNLDSTLTPDSPLLTEWRGDLLGGVTVIKGTFANGQPLLAIPNYARLNRGGRSIVWIRQP